MQALVDFYAGIALFVLASSLIGLAVLLFQPLFRRVQSARLRRADRHRPPQRPVAHPSSRPRSTGSDSARAA